MAPRNVLFNFHHIEEVHETYARFTREETFQGRALLLRQTSAIVLL